MALKRPQTVLHLATTTTTPQSTRCLHRLHAPTLPIPRPTPFVPDVPTFLTLIGRNLSAQSPKIPSWDALFSLSSAQLREAGIEPPRARRYLLWWRDRFRNGIAGVGGDLREVKDGVAELRVVEVESARAMDARATLTKGAGRRRVVVNVAPTVSLPIDPAAAATSAEDAPPSRNTEVPAVYDVNDVKAIRGVKIVHGTTIAGTGVEPVKGHQGVARLKVREGLWEQTRGHKVDGGERRRAEVRYKRAIAEKKAAR